MKLDWKAGLGLGITVFLLWWVLRDVDVAEVWSNIRHAHWWLLFAAVVVATAGFLIRAFRWRVLLHPIAPGTGLRNRYAAVNIGFMANNLLPARAGEFARAYALSKLEPVTMSAALGTLVIERVLDAFVYVVILLTVMSWPGFPSSPALREGPLAEMRVAIPIALGVLTLVIGLLVALPRTVVRVAERIAALLPEDFARPTVDALESFLDSLKVLRSPLLLAQALLWSFAFWLWHGLSYWLALLAFDIHVGPLGAYFTEIVVGFAVSIPAAPGFFGTFHAGASSALAVFGVPAANALAFAFGYHLGGFIPVTVIGLYYAGQMGLSLKDVGGSERRVEEAVEQAHPRAVRVLDRSHPESKEP